MQTEHNTNQPRGDHGLAYLLRYENIAWYDGDSVLMTDRRKYPMEKEKVRCESTDAVARAIADMVTQSVGPYFAALMAMPLAVKEARERREPIAEYCERQAKVLSTARPTTTRRMQRLTTASLEVIREALAAGEDPEKAAFDFAFDYYERRYRQIDDMGRYLVEQFPDKATVLTQCFAETIVGTMLRHIREAGKEASFICPETRPFWQGARLTASVIADMDFPVRVITDNMPAWIMQREGVDLFTCAADVITRDGHVINKVGTLQIALAARRFGIPFYCTGTPNPDHASADSVVIEERPEEQVTDVFGKRIVEEGVRAYYPAFDATPPDLVTGIVTPIGVYAPDDLERYFADSNEK